VTPEQWIRIEELYLAVVDRNPMERERLLGAADASVRREVEAMLAHNSASLPDLAELATGTAPDPSSASPPSCDPVPGTEIGQYRLEHRIGAGGMGVVFRAYDTKLQRPVAVKFLSEEVADTEARRRFQREARMASALNHPHILAVYDVGDFGGRQYLVTEFVDGGTLRNWAQWKPRSWQEVVDLLTGVADALAAAHQAGILHRDLKPDNVLVAASGYAKLADFGLAKLGPMAGQISGEQTAKGIIIGTLAYMSPEQVRSQPLDVRSDVFSFGATLYEMLAGHRAFCAVSNGELIAEVLHADPETLGEEIPAALRTLVKKALAKEPANRFASMRELLVALREVPRSTAPPKTSERRRSKSRWIPVAAAGTAVIASFWAGEKFAHRSPTAAEVVRFNVFPPEGNRFGNHPSPAISPDGRRVAFVTVGDRGYRMWIRALDQAEAQAIPSAEGGALPFWSPDGHAVAFFAADHKLKRIDLDGPSGVSPPLTLCDAADNSGGTWGRAGVIVFADRTGRLFRVPAGGGEAVIIDHKKSDPTEYAAFPSFLPDGRHFLYEAVIQKKRTIHVGSIDSPETSFVMESDSNAVFSRGTILYTHNSLLLAQPFDTRRFALTGNPVNVAEPVAVIAGYGNFSVAPETGTLVYAQGSAAPFALSWFDRSGKRLGALGEPINPVYPNSPPNLSPDGRKLATDHTESNNGDVWIYDTARGARERFTFAASLDISPVWSPDGKQIVFSSARKGPFDLYRKASDGTMPEQLLYADGRNKIATSWSRDGKFLLLQQCCDTPHLSIWVLPLPKGVNGPASEPYPLLESPVDEVHAEFSPDGKWIVYEANVPQHSGIYLARFERRPSSAAVVRQISSLEDAHFPRWKKDGREIFYFARQRLMAVPVTVRENTIEVGKEQEVLAPGETILGFDITADGQRFILKTRSPEAGLRPLTVVQNALADVSD